MATEATDLQRALLDRAGIRVGPTVNDYVARRLLAPASGRFAVMGVDARTGRPVTVLIDPAELLAPSAVAKTTGTVSS